MRSLIAALLLLCVLPAQSLTLQNFAGNTAHTWQRIGMPTAQPEGWRWLTVSDQRRFPAWSKGRELFVRSDLRPRETATGTLGPMAPADVPTLPWVSSWVGDDLEALRPSFRCGDAESNPMRFWMGFGTKPPDFVEILAQTPACVEFHWRTRIESIPLVIEGWTTVWSGQDVVEFAFLLSCGTTVPGSQWFDLPAVTMRTGERPVIDLSTVRGLRAPTYALQPDGSLRWTAEVAAAQRYLRASGITVRGAMLCGPTRVAEASRDPSRVAAQEWRREAPVAGIASPQDWDGHWLAFGVVPQRPVGTYADTEQARRLSQFLSRVRTPAPNLDYQPRPYAQPPAAGTTGEQAEFGASRCEHAVSMGAAWAVWDLLYSAEAETLRPIHNREPSGEPIRAVDHPEAILSGRVPDSRISHDMLGWPSPVEWINSPWPNIDDDQHRSDNLAHGVYALTRDRVLERTILDALECDKLGAGRGLTPPLGAGAGAPRAIGRTLIAMCHAHANGFADAEQMIRAAVARTYHTAMWRLTPEATVRVLWLNPGGAKYGWVEPDPADPERKRMIQGWVTWEEAIAVAGHYAAWLQLGLPEARELAIIGAKTISRHGWTPQRRLCYAVRWHGADTPLEPEQYDDPQQAFVGGVTTAWVLPALQILVELDPASPEAAIAREILSGYERRDWRDSCWRAVTR